MSKFRLTHLILLPILIIICGYVVLWLFHHLFPTSSQHTEITILLIIYLILISTTSITYSTVNLNSIHQYIGLNSVQTKYIFLSLLIASAIWAIDYFLQIYIFHLNVHELATQWYMKNSHSKLIFTFVSSVLLAPIIEEMLFRGVFLQAINHYLNTFWSAVVLSGLFALIHFDIAESVLLFVAALLYTWLTYRSKSIIPAICAHIINNFLTFIYYLDLANGK